MQKKINQFFRAIKKNNIELVKNLIKEGVDINAKDDDGWTALHLASKNAHLGIVSYLIANGADVNLKSDFGFTALMFASENGYLEIVKELIKAGADINVQDKNGWTALHLASFFNYKDIIIELIKAGANINAENIKKKFFMNKLIKTKYLPATIHRGARVKATCDAGSIIVEDDFCLNAAALLCEKVNWKYDYLTVVGSYKNDFYYIININKI